MVIWKCKLDFELNLYRTIPSVRKCNKVFGVCFLYWQLSALKMWRLALMSRVGNRFNSVSWNLLGVEEKSKEDYCVFLNDDINIKYKINIAIIFVYKIIKHC